MAIKLFCRKPLKIQGSGYGSPEGGAGESAGQAGAIIQTRPVSLRGLPERRPLYNGAPVSAGALKADGEKEACPLRARKA